MPTADLVSTIKERTPAPLRRWWRQVKQWGPDRRNRSTPAKDVFTDIYVSGTWGNDEDLGFCSGPGSDPAVAEPYAKFVVAFMATHGIGEVVDLGCGDFRVGRLIAPSCARYTGVDVVGPLIADNIRRYGRDTIRFEVRDITAEPLPDGELCLIREVFQHISNAQIQSILRQVRKYPYVLVTDSQPEDSSGYHVNKDRVHGHTTRVLYRSVLCLDKPPFNVPGVETVFETDVPLPAGSQIFGLNYKLRTFLIRH